MREFVMLLLIMGMVSAIVTILTPEGERGGIGKLVRFVAGACLIAVCISPMISFIERLAHFEFSEILPSESIDIEYESVLENGYLYAEMENTREGIKRILGERFDIDPSEVEVSLNFTVIFFAESSIVARSLANIQKGDAIASTESPISFTASFSLVPSV